MSLEARLMAITSPIEIGFTGFGKRSCGELRPPMWGINARHSEHRRCSPMPAEPKLSLGVHVVSDM